MSDPIDAASLYAQETLDVTVKGLTARYARERRSEQLVADVAAPVLRLAAQLRAAGDTGAADRLIEHTVHAGITATQLQEAQILEALTAPDHYQALFTDPTVTSLLDQAANAAAVAVDAVVKA